MALVMTTLEVLAVLGGIALLLWLVAVLESRHLGPATAATRLDPTTAATRLGPATAATRLGPATHGRTDASDGRSAA